MHQLAASELRTEETPCLYLRKAHATELRLPSLLEVQFMPPTTIYGKETP